MTGSIGLARCSWKPATTDCSRSRGAAYALSATATRGMTHVAISEQLDGKSVDWMEKVSDEQYRTN